MTAKQILDAFSETLMQDERILSPRERELLTSLLQNSKIVSSSAPEIQSAVTAAIARPKNLAMAWPDICRRRPRGQVGVSADYSQ
ncbi:MAG: hypothetical protein WB660_11965 [Candidatus Sulfotelmatobacter sp.]